MLEWRKFLKEQEPARLPEPITPTKFPVPDNKLENAKVTKWLNNLTKPKELGSLSPPFRVKLPDGKLSENPNDYPTKDEIKKDSRFCPTSTRVPFERESYRSVEKINGWYLHLFFDDKGKMVLKQIGSKKGNHNSKIHGSHYDHYGIMKKDGSGVCSYRPLEYAKHGAFEYLPAVGKKIKKNIKNIFKK